MRIPRYDVVIVGAGITGLVAAIAFKKQGKKILMIEKNDYLSDLGGGLAIWPNGTRFFDELDLSTKFKKISGKIGQVNYSNISGEHLCSIPSGRFKKHTESYFLFVKRPELVKFLFEQVKENEVIFNKELLDVRQEHNYIILIINGNEEIVADVVLGCDGINSKLRKIISPGSKKEYLGHISLGGIVKNLPIKNNFIFGKQFSCICFPCAKANEFYTIMFMPKSESYLKVARRKDQQKELFLGLSNEVDCIIDHVQDEGFFCLNAYQVSGIDAFYSSSSFLAGDAAHAISPISGLATGFAIEDIAILSKLLASNNINKAGEKYNKVMQKRSRLLKKFSNEVYVNPLLNDTAEALDLLKEKGAYSLAEKLVEFTQGHLK